MSRINTNVPAIKALNRLVRNQDDLGVRLERLSTGLRINRGRDDPAGLIVSERLRSEMRSLQQAIENSSRAANVVTTAEGALNETSALLLDLQELVIQTANEGGLSDAEVEANQLQIDSILNSIDRISNTTRFAGRKLLDGSQSYNISALPTAAITGASLFSVLLPQGQTRTVDIKVTQSALTAQVALVGLNASGTSTLSASTVEIRGSLGSQVLSFASGATLADVRTAINSLTAGTGVSAVVSAAGVTGVASALLLNSTTLGADAFVSVEPLGGNFVAKNEFQSLRDTGRDAKVIIDGQVGSARGLFATVRSNGIDAKFTMTQVFAQTLSSASFEVTGGGSIFQVGPEVKSSGQLRVGFTSTSTGYLGNPSTGRLFSLRSGQGNDLGTKNFSTAQSIVTEAIDQIASYRGRLGAVYKNQIQPSIDSQSITLENVTASESLIRDADIAEEVSALTRVQVLVQGTQSALQIANSLPNLVLSLLGG
jgi:flagellin